ncbi:MAG: DUF2284 domain-containing protein [Candidatus Lokiarchaeota archaeon]|nr:DUF2284 domain-containing protein [Candidatus Lokiarchaeota archaeon]
MTRESIQELVKKLRDLAIKKGANPDLIKLINSNQVIVPNSWVRMKCKFGCSNYGNRLCCPPYAPTPKETQNLLNEYSEALLIGFDGKPNQFYKHHKKMHKILLRLEIEAFRAGYEKAFIFIAGTCSLCKQCVLVDLPKEIHPDVAKRFCRHKNRMRPSMEAAGIDVFGTVKNAGLELETININNVDKIKHFGLLLID